jgi:hypothetical protein
LLQIDGRRQRGRSCQPHVSLGAARCCCPIRRVRSPRRALSGVEPSWVAGSLAGLVAHLGLAVGRGASSPIHDGQRNPFSDVRSSGRRGRCASTARALAQAAKHRTRRTLPRRSRAACAPAKHRGRVRPMSRPRPDPAVWPDAADERDLRWLWSALMLTSDLKRLPEHPARPSRARPAAGCSGARLGAPRRATSPPGVVLPGSAGALGRGHRRRPFELRREAGDGEPGGALRSRNSPWRPRPMRTRPA